MLYAEENTCKSTQGIQGQELHLFARQLPRLGLRPYVQRHLCACATSSLGLRLNPKSYAGQEMCLRVHMYKYIYEKTHLSTENTFYACLKMITGSRDAPPVRSAFRAVRDSTNLARGGWAATCRRHTEHAMARAPPQTRALAQTLTLWYSETRMSESLRSVRRSAAACMQGSRTECREPDPDPSLQRM